MRQDIVMTITKMIPGLNLSTVLRMFIEKQTLKEAENKEKITNLLQMISQNDIGLHQLKECENHMISEFKSIYIQNDKLKAKVVQFDQNINCIIKYLQILMPKPSFECGKLWSKQISDKLIDTQQSEFKVGFNFVEPKVFSSKEFCLLKNLIDYAYKQQELFMEIQKTEEENLDLSKYKIEDRTCIIDASFLENNETEPSQTRLLFDLSEYIPLFNCLLGSLYISGSDSVKFSLKHTNLSVSLQNVCAWILPKAFHSLIDLIIEADDNELEESQNKKPLLDTIVKLKLSIAYLQSVQQLIKDNLMKEEKLKEHPLQFFHMLRDLLDLVVSAKVQSSKKSGKTSHTIKIESSKLKQIDEGGQVFDEMAFTLFSKRLFTKDSRKCILSLLEATVSRVHSSEQEPFFKWIWDQQSGQVSLSAGDIKGKGVLLTAHVEVAKASKEAESTDLNITIQKCVDDIWKYYDQDNVGFLDKEELKKFVQDTMQAMDEGQEWNEEEFEKCFREFDKDESETIQKTKITQFIKKMLDSKQAPEDQLKNEKEEQEKILSD